MDRGVKYCECGCGRPAPIAKITNRRSGAVKGEAQRYIPGHHLQRLAAAKRIELAGHRFGRLTAIRLTRSRRSLWEVRCECGTTLHATTQSLRAGKVTSCGGPNCSDAPEAYLEIDCTKYLVTLATGPYRVRCGPLSAADQAGLIHAAEAGMPVRLLLGGGAKVELAAVNVKVIAVGWLWIEGTPSGTESLRGARRAASAANDRGGPRDPPRHH